MQRHGYCTLGEAFNRLDFSTAILDSRRFNYVVRVSPESPRLARVLHWIVNIRVVLGEGDFHDPEGFRASGKQLCPTSLPQTLELEGLDSSCAVVSEMGPSDMKWHNSSVNLSIGKSVSHPKRKFTPALPTPPPV